MATPYVATIGASNKTHEIAAGSLRFSEALQARGSINFRYIPDDPLDFVTKWQPVTIQKDGVVIAKGIVQRPPYGGVAGHGTTQTEVNVSCGDLKTHWEKRRLTAEIPAGTLKSVLQHTALADIYTDQGFSLSGTQDNGPTIGPFAFTNDTLFDAIRQACDACDPVRVVTLDLDTLVFQVIEPSIGNLPAPWDISDADQKQNVDGDLNVEPNGNLEANNVLVEFGSDSLVPIKDTWTGDGSTDEFPLSYPVAGPANPASGYVGRYVVRNGPHWETVGTLGSGKVWEYDPDALTITRTSGAPANGNALWMAYLVQYPQTVRAFDAPSIADIGQIDYVVKAPNLYSKAEAQRIADQTLAAMLGGPRTVRYPTTRAGLRVGMTQHIQSTIRAIDADCLITDVQGQDNGGDCLVYQITAIEGGLPPKPWQDTARQAFSGGSSSGGGSSTAPPSPGSTSGSTDDIGPDGNGFATASCGLKCLDWFLTDAEIKALPTTYKPIIPAPGPNKIIVVLRAAGVIYKNGGAYSGIDAGQGWVFAYGPTWTQGDATDYCGIDNREFLSWAPCPDSELSDAGDGFLRQYTLNGTGIAGQVNQPIYLVGWNDGGDYGGGNAANFAAGRIWYFELEVPAPNVVESSCETTAWSDDFESGSALSSDYDGNLDVAKTAGVGFGGSKGLQGTGTPSDAFFGYVSKIVSLDNRRGCVTCKIKPDTTTIENETPCQIVRISSTTDTSFAPQFNIELNCGDGGVLAGAVGFNVRGDANIFNNEIPGVLSNGVWVEFRIEWEMSSVLAGVRQADGWAKLFINGTLAYEVSGILLNDPNPSWASANPNNYWQLVQFCPLGLGDDLVIGKP